MQAVDTFIEYGRAFYVRRRCTVKVERIEVKNAGMVAKDHITIKTTKVSREGSSAHRLVRT